MTFVAPARDPRFAESELHGEQAQKEFLRKVLTHCTDFRIAVDIGAHIGLCTEFLCTKFGRVWAFEPCAENFACLQKNVGGRAILVNAALGATEGECEMYLEPGANSGMWHAREGVGTEVTTLDMMMLTHVDFIKIDTEGFEGCVLAGARETIANSRPLIVLEDNGLGQKYFGSGWVDPAPILRELGYEPKTRIRKDAVWVPR